MTQDPRINPLHLGADPECLSPLSEHEQLSDMLRILLKSSGGGEVCENADVRCQLLRTPSGRRVMRTSLLFRMKKRSYTPRGRQLGDSRASGDKRRHC